MQDDPARCGGKLVRRGPVIAALSLSANIAKVAAMILFREPDSPFWAGLSGTRVPAPVRKAGVAGQHRYGCPASLPVQ
jgi:hypothetical protein